MTNQTIHFRGEVIIPIGRGHFLVESWSEDESHHAVDLEEQACSCKGFLCRGHCRHLEVLNELLQELSQQEGPAG